MENDFNEIKQAIIKQLIECPYQGDIGDIGNEIGIVIGKFDKDLIRDFKWGLDHGVSLSNGTH